MELSCSQGYTSIGRGDYYESSHTRLIVVKLSKVKHIAREDDTEDIAINCVILLRNNTDDITGSLVGLLLTWLHYFQEERCFHSYKLNKSYNKTITHISNDVGISVGIHLDG